MVNDPVGDGQALILTVAPNGAYKQAHHHPALPLTPRTLANTARHCLDAGAAMLHLHVRKPDGAHSLDPQDYRDAVAAVRKAVGDHMVVQITTEAAGVYAPPQQMAAVRELRPEAVSVGLREFRGPEVSEKELSGFFQDLLNFQVMTQVILYDADDVNDWNALRKRGVIPDGPWFLLFVLGRYSQGQQSSPSDLQPFLKTVDLQYPWAMCAFGAAESQCALAAASLGGHVRVGFENNLLLHNGQTAPDNAALVKQVAEHAALLNRPLANAEYIRQRFATRGFSGAI